MNFSGMNVIESTLLVEDGEPYTAWLPCGRSGWRVKRILTPKIPYRGVLCINATTLVMHPVTLRELRKLLHETQS